MKLTYVQFVHVVFFGGQLQSASNKPVGDRPGQGAMDIELDDKMRFVALTKNVNGKPATKLVPMSNIAAFDVAEGETEVKAVKK